MAVDWLGVEKEAEVRLATLNRHKSELESKLRELVNEEQNLRNLIGTARKMGNSEYWNSLLDASGEDKSDKLARQLEQVGRPLETAGAASHPEEAPQLPMPLPSLPPPIGVSRKVDPSNTTYRVGALMLMKGEPMTFDDVWHEFNDRNWVSPEWNKPEGAIRQAMRRTEQYGWTRKVGAQRYVFDPDFHDDRRREWLRRKEGDVREQASTQA